MSHSKNYDNNKNKNNVQSKTNPVDDLNEILSVENASAERILSRIDQTPIQKVKQRLKQHLKETHIQKNRLRRIIGRLGGKPTDAKADLSLSFISTTMPMGNNFPKTVKSKTEDNSLENSMPEEYELVQISEISQ
jgi:ferritin-like metal-binding protein YciE